jgi:hypothetical protein
MARSLDEVKRELRARLAELRPLVDEYRQLERAAEALGVVGEARGGSDGGGSGSGSSGPGSGSRSASGTSRRSSGRARRGDNKQAVFAVINERPGVSVGEIAQVTKIGKPLVYGVTRKGVERGELDAVDLGGGRKGFKVADPASRERASAAAVEPEGKTLDEATEGIEDPDAPAPVGG